MKVMYKGNLIETERIGSYGTFGDPVVLINSEEHVAEEYFVDPESGGQVSTVCHSNGYDFCIGTTSHSGCRFGEDSDLPTAYFV